MHHSTMDKILALWTTMRSTSTAFLQSIKERGDFRVHNEPFCLSFYLSEDRLSTRFGHLPTEPEHNYQRVLERLKKQVSCEPLFIKDMASHVIHLANEEFLSCFEHTFLIRNPAKTLPSLFEQSPDFTLQEAGYAALWGQFERVADFMGRVPVVIDSDDLVRHPYATMMAYCEAVRIPFLPEALTWQIDSATSFSHFDSGDEWFTTLKSSSGFLERVERNYVSVEENEHLQQAYDASWPYYTKLYAHRLRIPVEEQAKNAS